MDRGPWRAHWERVGDAHPKLKGVASDDFGADVVLTVSGDFRSPEEKQRYCEWLVEVLNKASERFVTEQARQHPETD